MKPWEHVCKESNGDLVTVPPNESCLLCGVGEFDDDPYDEQRLKRLREMDPFIYD